ncbi:MAG: hypothetical protein JL50_08630 [Peptococcaceae bacterium BICA1-7]|nr:MAG: hypothetical protein JL50_08630 [Peptococcaceae bacterium BICA1-7]HBV97371.1 hypothetical protein [Desulfotomaculum sp.]
MPKSRANRAAIAIGRAATGGGPIEMPEELGDLSNVEMAEAMREWEESLAGLPDDEAQRQRQEIAQLMAEFRRSRGSE